MSVETETQVLQVSDTAREKIKAVLDSQEPPATAIRVTSPFRGKYAMNLEPEGKPNPEDTVLDFGAFQVFVDSESLPFVDGSQLDYVETYGGGGFQFTNNRQAPQITAKQAPEGPEGDIWRQIQEVLDEQVNPMVASHGGYIELIEVKDSDVFIRMSGGCQGCGMAAMTLKQGVERLLRDQVPSIGEIMDVTDHAGGRNPYYAAS
jgi:Fe/S biogenesis protein NfuA